MHGDCETEMPTIHRPAVSERLANDKQRSALIRVTGNIGLIFLGALLFSLSFPGLLSVRGLLFPVAFVAIAPIFLVVRRSSWIGVMLYGLLYGFLSYSLFNYWLLTFHPLAIFIVPSIYAIYFVALFPLLKLAIHLFPRHGYLLQTALWLAYELLRTQGFLGYSYGIMGYSQYLFRPLIQIAEIGGVWAVSLLVVFPSALLGNLLWLRRRDASGIKQWWPAVPAACGWVLAMAATLIFGFASMVDYSASRRWRVALVQQNIDPWRGGLRAYRDSLAALKRQSLQALAENPEIVIWSETSFVPAIDYHRRYRGSAETYRLVQELDEFLAPQSVPFVIGNDDGQLRRNRAGQLERIDYNAVLLYDKGAYGAVYRKLHLVPFTEHFPYRRLFPWLHRLLVENESNFWEAGSEYTVFEAAGVRFSTPICFEDTFGYLSRNFVRSGAEVIVNMTNDSWSQSVPAEMQHMTIGLFRAVENRRSLVRSTNGGITTVIDPNGSILASLPAFVEDYLVYDVPVYTERTTLYTRFGDWLGWLLTIGAAVGIVSGIMRRVLLRTARRADIGDKTVSIQPRRSAGKR